MSSVDGFDRRNTWLESSNQVARQIAPSKYPDGDGLSLIVAGRTSRNWSYRYWINGKERWHGLGR
ncbi:Arm DNA-binding domain-containing protein [Bradyrhizobium canariense]|uniref:Arm DNA-binding domain-containing protein n=1 Tax=Bradyrhizobium canariense TaxID=255045 RepID=UPI0011BA601D|nr:Arm DNA-binding domain-containing protein [Bradyrhizobium canariense]